MMGLESSFLFAMASRTGIFRLVYSCIADRRKITYETGDTSSYRDLIESVLARCVLDVRKSFDHPDKGVTVNYISQGERIWLCVAQKGLNTRIAFAFLEHIRSRSLVASPTSDTTLTSLMRTAMDNYTSNADRIAAVNREIEAIKEVMLENMASVLRRGERLEDLQIRSEQLQENATLFNRNATKLKSHFRWANLRWYLIGFAALVIIAIAIAWGICGLTFHKCRK
jgi:vesicle-associated membrane protein 7